MARNINRLSDKELLEYILDKDIWIKGYDKAEPLVKWWLHYEKVDIDDHKEYGIFEYFEGQPFEDGIRMYTDALFFPSYFVLERPVDTASSEDLRKLSEDIIKPYWIRVTNDDTSGGMSIEAIATDMHIPNLSQQIVVFGGDDEFGCEEAEWWINAKNKLDIDSIGSYEYDLIDKLMDIAMADNPGLELEYVVLEDPIDNYSKECVSVKGSIDLNIFADYYYGNLYYVDLYTINNDEDVIDDTLIDTVSISKAEYVNSHTALAKYFNIDPNEIAYVNEDLEW